MPVPKLCTTGTVNITNSEGNDSPDTVFRQAISKDPLLPFSRTGDNSVQWIQLLHALDQPDIPGWPLMTPIKVQMQKCGKCSKEFCSTINYRRHIRIHHRSLKGNKESHKQRDSLAAFWDKLSLEEAKEVVSFNDVLLKEIPGSSVVGALASFLHQPGVWTLPHFYVKAGSILLDIIQANPSGLPISSEELFSILDDASEGTFLCAGTAESVQKYLFDGEAAKINIELKNLVACTSFLFEQKLVKAWVADKDVEALRWQKLLMEEEEAAQKRQAELLERKKQKKLRRKEQKAKNQNHGYRGNLSVDVVLAAADGSVLAEASELSTPSDSSSNSVDRPSNLDSCIQPLQFVTEESVEDIEAQVDLSCEIINLGHLHNIEPQMVGENGDRHVATNGFHESQNLQILEDECVEDIEAQVDLSCEIINQGHSHNIESQMVGENGDRHVATNGFHESQNLQIFEDECVAEVVSSNDWTPPNWNQAWTDTHKMEGHGESLKPLLAGEMGHQMEETNCQVVIGSIPVTVRRGGPPVKRVSGEIIVLEKVNNQITPSGGCIPSQSMGNTCNNRKHSQVLSDENAAQGDLWFSSIAAKEFLMRRWKEAISGDHVKLVLSPTWRPPGCSDVQQSNSIASTS